MSELVNDENLNELIKWIEESFGLLKKFLDSCEVEKSKKELMEAYMNYVNKKTDKRGQLSFKAELLKSMLESIIFVLENEELFEFEEEQQ
ncbi:hypothetical protein JKN53_000105 [Enterococcus faecalis]|uniref:hypothetical protein n=1 Tax=Enterococcus faecalis TaxID=1351 RepID=UPI00143085D0|nr:hypothetical protein [Enterococcus faecalis]EHA4031124.1 hypothetical protein [Enterococcus faecalis]EHY9169207.1 hypothetical protein [Enterococcus faecalis]NJJ99895.1 hypothetical protein [Enterococcus faecalis]DAL40890.1 MAG TPA_asm: hypothetical protein [Caudoviricetes sp.]